MVRTCMAACLLVAALPQAAAAERTTDPHLPPAGPEPELTAVTHEVKSGETLSEIAVAHDKTVEALLEFNPGLDPDHIRAGQSLNVSEGLRRVVHTVQPGETLAGIAARYGVPVKNIMRWNRKQDAADRLPAGRRLIVYTDAPESRSESVGSPSSGALVHGVRLPRNPGYVIRYRDRAWGTEKTVTGIAAAFQALRKLHARAPRVRVHDLSHRVGGPMDDHKSHQSGRDADIAYYQKQCSGTCLFRRIDAAELDVERQWTLLKYWLERDLLEAVFMDYSLQRPLYRYAREQGATREQLNRWFQYPNGKGYPLGVIRHFPKHSDHFHVRFACDETDERCKTFRPLLHRTAHATR